MKGTQVKLRLLMTDCQNQKEPGKKEPSILLPEGQLEGKGSMSFELNKNLGVRFNLGGLSVKV